MKSSCIQHPKNEPMIQLRKWQYELCEGNRAAALLLSYFEYWHNIRLEMSARAAQANKVAEEHGEEGTQDTSLFQFHTNEQLQEGTMHLCGKNSLIDGVKLLVKKGFISIHKNPNPRYRFDQTNYYLFHADVVNEALEAHISHRLKINDASFKNKQPSFKNKQPVFENKQTIPEITTEITTEKKPPLTPPPVEGKKRRKRKESVLTPTQLVRFERWYAHYPNKKSRGQAEQAFATLDPDDALVDQMITAVLEACGTAKWQKDNGEYIPYPATWIRAKGWLDEYVTLATVEKAKEQKRAERLYQEQEQAKQREAEDRERTARELSDMPLAQAKSKIALGTNGHVTRLPTKEVCEQLDREQEQERAKREAANREKLRQQVALLKAREEAGGGV